MHHRITVEKLHGTKDDCAVKDTKRQRIWRCSLQTSLHWLLSKILAFLQGRKFFSLILSGLCMPFAADKNWNTPPQGEVSKTTLKEALIPVVPFFKKNSGTYSFLRLCRTMHGAAESCWLSTGWKLAEKILDSAAPSFPVISKDCFPCSKMIPSHPPLGPLFSFTVRGLQRLFRSIIHRRSNQRRREIRVITGGKTEATF